MSRSSSLRVLALVAAMVGAFMAPPAAAAQLKLSSAGSPVGRVTTLLRDMLVELEGDAAADQATYEKMVCWCTTGDSEKTASIAAAEAHIKDLGTQIEKLTARIARLAEEIDRTKKEVADNTAALTKATEMRVSDLAAFQEEEAFLMGSISSLASALDVLGKHSGASLMQLSAMSGVSATIRRVMGRRGLSSLGHLRGIALTPSQTRLLAALQEEALTGQPVAVKSSDSQSGQILGVIAQMKETFEQDLASGREEESKAQRAYEELKAAKNAETAAGNSLIAKRTQEHADADEAKANAMVDLEDTTNALTADQEFLVMLKEKCTLTDKEYQERLAMRQSEMGAVSKALAVFSGDAAKDLFSRTMNFMQSFAAAHSERRQQASQLLSALATQTHSSRLSQLAARVRLDAFTKVKKAIDDMIAALLKEKEDEIKHKDFCIDELNANKLQTEQREREKSDLLSKMDALQTSIQSLTDEINTLKAEIGDLQLNLKRVSEDREAESRLFQRTVADQRSSQRLLQAALTILKDQYGSALLQQPVGAPPPSDGFKGYNKNAQSGGVMAAITQIMEDTQAMEKEAIKTEEDSVATYAAFVLESNASIEAKDRDIVSKVSARAKTEGELTETTQAKDFTVSELEQLQSYNAELHKSCDYVVKNFDVRQEARDQEVAGLKQAKAILSGAVA